MVLSYILCSTILLALILVWCVWNKRMIRDCYSSEHLDAFYQQHFHRSPDFLVRQFYTNRPTPFVRESLQLYLHQTFRGKQHGFSRRLVIAGLLRNGSQNIPTLKKYLLQMTTIFQDVRVVIVENDSMDGTREALLAWAHADPRIVILCDDTKTVNTPVCTIPTFSMELMMSHGESSQRIRRMAFLRNIYLKYVRDHWKDYDYFMVLDMDLFGTIFNDGIFHSLDMFATDPGINGICCNGIIQNERMFVYYDSFAYIPPNSSYIFNTISDKVVHDTYVHTKITEKYLHSIDLDRVFSAFGGLCIYRMEAVAHEYIWYGFSDTGFACEHSFLNRHIPNLFVNPRMIFLIASNP